MNTNIHILLHIAEQIRDTCVVMHDINGHISIADNIEKYAKQAQHEIDILTGALQQSEHFIVFSTDGWSIEHLVSCRPNMTDCEYHKAAQVVYGRLGVPYTSGRYKMTLYDNDPGIFIPRIGLDEVK